MNNNWQKVKLSEIIQLIGGGTPKTTNNTYWNGNIPWLSVVDFNDDNRYVTTTEKTITELGLQNSTTHLLDKGDIIISARGTVGALAQLATPMAFNQSCYGIKATERSCNDFLYYLLKNSIGKLKKNTHGSVFNTITRDTFSNIVVSIPPLDEQRKIAGILSALDDKIELNNKINRNLEAQAQAIFKSWFIDFEPFKNGKFIDSELGKIPEGWKVYRLSELCEIITKGTTPTTLKRSFKNKGINFIKAENISNNHLIDKTKLAFIDIQTHELLSRSQLKPFDILFTIAGTIGRFAIVLPDIIPANTNQAIAIIRCKDIYTLLVYSMFLCGNHLTYFNSKVVQAVQANLSLSTIGSLPMLLPPKAVVERYISIVYPLFKLTFDNSDESSHLAQLRNALLPKLMTGKVNISDILV